MQINRDIIMNTISYEESATSPYFISAVEKKLTGFIDFDLQTNRPQMKGSNAHDKRFETFDHFPKNCSNTRNI